MEAVKEKLEEVDKIIHLIPSLKYYDFLEPRKFLI
jgi:hypothetical protein